VSERTKTGAIDAALNLGERAAVSSILGGNRKERAIACFTAARKELAQKNNALHDADVALDVACQFLSKRMTEAARPNTCPMIGPGLAANCGECSISRAMYAARAARGGS